MNKFVCFTAVTALLTGVCNAAVIRFSDDFSGGTLDTAKWTADVDAGNNLSVHDGVLEAEWYGGLLTKQKAYAVSEAIYLSDAWESFSLLGSWMTSGTRGEYVIEVQEAGDENTFCRVSYYYGGGGEDRIRWKDSNSSGTFTRTVPSGMTSFGMEVTDTGWSYTEGGNPVVNQTTPHMAGVTDVRIKVGGWQDSYSASPDSDSFDHVQLELVPEPATLCALALGAVVVLIRRCSS